MSVPHPHRIALLAAATALLALPCGAEPPAPKQPDEAVAKVRKAAEQAEVHGVGLYRPAVSHVGKDDVTDWPKFAQALRSRKGPGGRIHELLDKESQGLLADDKVVARLGDRLVAVPTEVLSLKSFVVNQLTRILDRPDFYMEEAFKGVALSKELKDAIVLGEKRTPFQTAYMNRRLLDAAFPDVIAETPARFRTVRVEVVGGKDVVLVLSSSEMCRWEVKLHEGAKVTGVLLCGYYPQEVAGVSDVPIVYRTLFPSDGKPRKATSSPKCRTWWAAKRQRPFKLQSITPADTVG
jgi:hypothetical protein